jgi:hypothetical protein
MFAWDERKPGFFEFDRVAHCGADASDQFCQSLTGTDVSSGWTGEHPLLNSAHRWVKEHIEQMGNELPFPFSWTLTATMAMSSSTTLSKTGAA